MNDEQIKEVMRLADEIADYAWKQGLSDGAYSQADHDRKSCDASRAALEAHLRTIGEPAGYSLPVGSIGAKKFAQVGGGFTPVGLVFSRGESAMAITEHGRVYWDRDLVHPISGEPEQSVNAELLEALKGMVDAHAIPSSYCKERPAYEQAREAIARAESAMPFWPNHPSAISDPLFHQARGIMGTENFGQEEALRLAILHVLNARAESAIDETPAKVSPCAGHAVQQEADLRQIVGIKEAIAGIREFFDSEYHSGITGIVDTSKVCGDRVEDECRPTFDHCYVNQGGGGITGDDFHGTVYFHIGNGEYATVDC